MAFCAQCGTQLPPDATVCPACGRGVGSVATVPAVTGATGGLTDNVAGMLAYITIIPAIIFLVTAPYNKNRFIRFHSFQCIFFWVAIFVIQVALGMLGVIPFLLVLTIPLHTLIWAGSVILWIVLLLKAYQGQMWKLPVVGDLAEKQANVL
ncbi:MAG: DUF4870 domain-containing protein [Acidobacteriales bacterium]|nr:DUF4870 domain-containing protein [Terriglobales bacterium]